MLTPYVSPFSGENNGLAVVSLLDFTPSLTKTQHCIVLRTHIYPGYGYAFCSGSISTTLSFAYECFIHSHGISLNSAFDQKTCFFIKKK